MHPFDVFYNIQNKKYKMVAFTSNITASKYFRGIFFFLNGNIDYVSYHFAMHNRFRSVLLYYIYCYICCINTIFCVVFSFFSFEGKKEAACWNRGSRGTFKWVWMIQEPPGPRRISTWKPPIQSQWGEKYTTCTLGEHVSFSISIYLALAC